MLCTRTDGQEIEPEVVTGPGIGHLERPPEDVFFDAVAPWITRFGRINVVMAGMVGSNIGWREASYVDCPLDRQRLAAERLIFKARGHSISILPGVCNTNALGAPDVMRGEEVQILGWMSLNPAAAQSGRLLCLPGTHTKWAHVANGALQSFGTSPTGELFAMIKSHSVLLASRDAQVRRPLDEQSFDRGLEMIRTSRNALMHAIFSTRSIALREPATLPDPESYLSGLLIGSDVWTALREYTPGDGQIDVIGDPALCGKFSRAIEHFGCSAATMDGVRAVHAGFRSISL